MTGPRSCPSCGGTVRRVRNTYCGLACYRAALDQRRGDRDDALMSALKLSGLTVTLSELARRSPKPSIRRDLDRLMRDGRVGRIGERYFPTSWLTVDRL